MRATRAIIYRENLRFNIDQIREKIGSNVKLCVPVKADAYGHGAVEIAAAAMEAGAFCLAVASVQEGEILRQGGIEAPIMLFSLPIPEDIAIIIDSRLTPFVADEQLASMLDAAAKQRGARLSVHLKVDTGMGRIGCTPDSAVALAKAILAYGNLALEGVCTHLPASSSTSADDILFTRNQIASFAAVVDSIRKAGIDPGIVHAANSGGVLFFPECYFDMVRPGILVYGYYPSADLPVSIPVKPVMELETRIVFLKKVPAGTPISYGRTYTTTEETEIATIPVGYGDGLNRLMSSNGEVAIKGKRYPIVGRVCMDQCMVNLGRNSGVKLYDRAIVFGPTPAAPTADDIARRIGTIPYEVTCNINKRVPRVYP
jgi:alanine racemase